MNRLWKYLEINLIVLFSFAYITRYIYLMFDSSFTKYQNMRKICDTNRYTKWRVGNFVTWRILIGSTIFSMWDFNWINTIKDSVSNTLNKSFKKEMARAGFPIRSASPCSISIGSWSSHYSWCTFSIGEKCSTSTSLLEMKYL